nr:MAG TPA: hypothetical protein [Caudoviricetes sp.]
MYLLCVIISFKKYTNYFVNINIICIFAKNNII